MDVRRRQPKKTTGLIEIIVYTADTARLLGVLQRLVEVGYTVFVVALNLELIKGSDLVIDPGPEGRAAGASPSL